MNNLRESFSETLRALRVKSGLSQEALGNETDLGRVYISELERGLKEPSLLTVFRICEGLKIKPTDFVSAVEKRMKR